MVEIDPVILQRAIPVIRKFINDRDLTGVDEKDLQSILKDATPELANVDVDPALLNGANLPGFLAAVNEDLKAFYSTSQNEGGEKPPVAGGELPTPGEETETTPTPDTGTGTPTSGGGTPPPDKKTGEEEESGLLNTLTKNWPWLGVIGGAVVAFFGFLKGSSNSSSGSVLAGIAGAAVAVYSLLTAIPSLLFGKKTEEATPEKTPAPEAPPTGS